MFEVHNMDGLKELKQHFMELSELLDSEPKNELEQLKIT
jgi:hypothetical protein